ncbi:nucleolar 58 protein [Rutstroemia sp. NJR-2017a WRK4]|nr:nucleolar 58 protein [Rutstroemia sp. NJR-2017a WRK4]
MAPLFILTETAAGMVLFKADKKILKKDDLSSEIESAEGINGLLKLKQFQKFDSAATALEEVAALVEGKVSPMLSQLLDTLKDEKKASLAVADPKLGQAINKIPGLTLTPISDSKTNDIFRGIREHLPSLIPGLLPEHISTMSLGLSHSLSRHKLKFSPDKVDTMIVQAISLLDDLDKELNTYAMRVKEWYGWHFPEMGKIVNDNLAYARVILKVGMRTNTSNTDLSDILPEEIEAAIKAAAEVSMGTEITDEDLENIQLLAEQVVGFTEYRQQLSSYLTARMQAIAPNLTELVGELVGARLISHAGSLMNLAKSPASTIQILGAEKALFRALKTKHDTPKYGLIYHASLVGQATGKNKGKIARMLAAKAAIGLRVDALSDWSAQGEGKGDDVDEEERSALGVLSRAKLERTLRGLEGKPLPHRGVAVGPNGKAVNAPAKWEVKEARKYNADADGLAGDEPAAATPAKKEKKNKKLIEEVAEASESENESDASEKKSKKDKKKDKEARRAEKAAKKAKKADKGQNGTATEDPDEKHAKALGLELSKYKAKAAKGLVQFDAEGNPELISKSDLKKAKKGEDAVNGTEEVNGKKRKSEDGVEKMAGLKLKKRARSRSPERDTDRDYRKRSRSPRRERKRSPVRDRKPDRDREVSSHKNTENDDLDIAAKFGSSAASKVSKSEERNERDGDKKEQEEEEDTLDIASKFGASAYSKLKSSSSAAKKKPSSPTDTSLPPSRPSAPISTPVSTSAAHSNEPMIIVHVNDRLGTKAAIPCLASDPIKLFKAQVAARIGRQPHEILLKRQGERPFKDALTLEDYGVGNGVQIDLEIDTGE